MRFQVLHRCDSAKIIRAICAIRLIRDSDNGYMSPLWGLEEGSYRPAIDMSPLWGEMHQCTVSRFPFRKTIRSLGQSSWQVQSTGLKKDSANPKKNRVFGTGGRGNPAPTVTVARFLNMSLRQ